MDEEKSNIAADYTKKKKKFCWTVGLAVRIFPDTKRTFTKDTTLSENGMGTACYVWIGLKNYVDLGAAAGLQQVRHQIFLIVRETKGFSWDTSEL